MTIEQFIDYEEYKKLNSFRVAVLKQISKESLDLPKTTAHTAKPYVTVASTEEDNELKHNLLNTALDLYENAFSTLENIEDFLLNVDDVTDFSCDDMTCYEELDFIAEELSCDGAESIENNTVHFKKDYLIKCDDIFLFLSKKIPISKIDQTHSDIPESTALNETLLNIQYAKINLSLGIIDLYLENEYFGEAEELGKDILNYTVNLWYGPYARDWPLGNLCTTLKIYEVFDSLEDIMQLKAEVLHDQENYTEEVKTLFELLSLNNELTQVLGSSSLDEAYAIESFQTEEEFENYKKLFFDLCMIECQNNMKYVATSIFLKNQPKELLKEAMKDDLSPFYLESSNNKSRLKQAKYCANNAQACLTHLHATAQTLYAPTVKKTLTNINDLKHRLTKRQLERKY